MSSTTYFPRPANSQKSKADSISELTDVLQNELKKRDKFYKDIPTPIDFAKLERDVNHHGKLIYGMLIAAITILIGGYLHFDNKITSETKDMENRYQYLENKVNGNMRSINSRIDGILISDRFVPKEKSKKPITTTSTK